MLFGSVEFLLFFLLVLLVDLQLQRHAGPRKVFLLAVSYVFYASWDWRFLGLIWLSTAVDWVLGGRIASTESPSRRKWLLIASLSMNLGLLGVFKYLDFFIDGAARLLTAVGFSANVHTLGIILPVGISFYTFQTLSYTLDIYHGKLRPAPSWLDFALFVAFFPQLVAGPIVRARELLPQIKRNPKTTRVGFADGLYDVLSGLFKKVVIADILGARLVDPFFSNPEAFGLLGALAAVYGYAFQLYGDFAGYSQIAIGTARMLGYRLPRNFRAPYMARNLAELWSRWHMTLTTWIRDYIFVPLGGFTRGQATGVRNLIITFVVFGLWHRAGLNPILFGLFHGSVLGFSAAARRRQLSAGGRRSDTRWAVFWRRFRTFNLIWVPTTILFRAESFADASAVFAALTRAGGPRPPLTALGVLAIAILLHVKSEAWNPPLRARFVQLAPELQGAALVALFGLLSHVTNELRPFIYFQF